MLYRLCGGGTPPDDLPLDDAWDGRPDVGWLVFLAAPPAPGTLPALSDALALLPQRTHTSVAWTTWDGRALGTVQALPIRAAADGPVTAETATFPAMPGITKLGVLDSSPVGGVRDGDGSLQALSLAYPPQPAHDGRPASLPPSGPGVLLPLAGADGAGCLRFRALVDDGSRSAGAGARKRLAEVSLDPVRPFDPKRTWTRLTAVRFELARDASGAFTLTPLAPPARSARR